MTREMKREKISAGISANSPEYPDDSGIMWNFGEFQVWERLIGSIGLLK
jgi:hypothetical protein